MVAFPYFSVKVLANLGSNVTLPCGLPSKDTMFFGATGVRVKWTKLADDPAFNEDVLLSMGFHKKTFGSFEDRVFIVNNNNEDGSILITNIAMKDAGKYQCELINGMTDVVQEVNLEVLSGLRDGKYAFATRFGSCSVFASTNFCFVDSNQQENRSISNVSCFSCIRYLLSSQGLLHICYSELSQLVFCQSLLHLVPFFVFPTCVE